MCSARRLPPQTFNVSKAVLHVKITSMSNRTAATFLIGCAVGLVLMVWKRS